jgi:hypothetical protein
LSPDAELLVTGAFSNEGWMINAADFGASWVSSAASSSKRWRRSKSNPANRARTLASPADVPFSSSTYDFHQLFAKCLDFMTIKATFYPLTTKKKQPKITMTRSFRRASNE